MRPIILVNLLLFVASASHVSAIGTASGTTVELNAQAEYSDPLRPPLDNEPALTVLHVLQVAGVVIEHDPPYQVTTPGTNLYIPIRIVNAGNGPDSFGLTIASANGWPVAIIYDDNNDGIHQATETWQISSAGPMVADGYSPCFARVLIPVGTVLSDTLTVSATSGFNPAVSTSVQLRAPGAPDPVITITSPTSQPTYSTTNHSLSLAGTAADDVAIANVSWSNSRGGTGVCSGTTAWSASGVLLKTGQNVVTVTATDTDGNTGTDTITVTYTDTDAPTVSVTSPTAQPTYSTGSSTVTLSGTADDYAGVQSVRWACDSGGSGTCTGTTAWSASGITLKPGANVITVTATDAAGNSGTDAITLTYTDTDLPTVSITGPTSQPTYSTNLGTLTVSGSASDNIAVSSVSWSNNRGGSGACSGTTAWSASGVTLKPGANVITVAAADAAGNSGTDTLTVTCTDTDTPTVAITSPTSQPTYATSSSTIALAGTAADYIGVNSVSWSNNRGGSGTCAGTTAWSASGVTLQPGANVITVTATDTAGNTGTDTVIVTYTDADVPTVAVTAPTAQPTYSTNTSTIALSGAASDNIAVSSVSWSNDKGGSGVCSGTTTWSASGITLKPGANVITVTANDAAGNAGSATVTVTYTDAEAPVVAITGPTSQPTYSTNVATLTVSGSANDNLAASSVSWSNDRGGSGACSGTAAWSAAGIALKPGANVITITAVDAAGNTGAAAITVTYTDTDVPTVAITGPTRADTYSTGSATITLSGSADDNVGVESVAWSCDGGGSGICTGTGSWSAASIPLSPGENVITVSATDATGNSASDTVTVSYVSDTTAPTVEITSPTTTGSCARNVSVLGLAGTTTDDTATADLTWSNDTTGTSGACVLEDGAWTAEGIELAPGENTITVTGYDTAGNPGSASAVITYVESSPGDAWRGLAMVSAPIVPDEPDPKKATGFYGNSWLAFMPETNSYASYPDRLSWFDPAEATPGRGFWACWSENALVPAGNIPPQDQPATIHLKPGWNLVGTPFISAVRWDISRIQVQVTGGSPMSIRESGGLVATFAWGWRQDDTDPRTGSYYLVYDSAIAAGYEDELEPWRAYWIRANGECDMTIPPPE